MPDYKKMYIVLCNAIDRVIDPLEQIPSARPYAGYLKDALLTAEDIYIDTSLYGEKTESANIILLKSDCQSEI